MFSPQTPKKVDDGITALVRTLSAKWGLNLPLRDAKWSPARDSDLRRAEDQVFSRIRFLFYNHKDPLQYAIDQFEKHAISIFSHWKFKPRADIDVLPTRSTPDSTVNRDAFLRQTEITEDAAAELTLSLLRFLREVTDRVQSKVDYRDPDGVQDPSIDETTPQGLDRISVRSASSQSFGPQASTSRNFASLQNGPSPRARSSRSQLPSSDEFNPDIDTSNILEDITMMDMPNMTAAVTPSKSNVDPFRITMFPLESVDEEYQTPPTSPLLDKVERITSLENSKGEAYFQKTYDMVQLPEPVISGKKRPFLEPVKPSAPRKVSRDGNNDEIPRLYNVHHLSPFITTKDPEEERYGYPTLDTNFKKPFSVNQAMSRSSGSIATSIISTAWTTPNVSFNAESAMTSFTSSADASDLAEATTVEPPDFKDDSRGILQYPPSETWTHQSGEIDKAMAQSASVARKTVDQYLTAHLFLETPFGINSDLQSCTKAHIANCHSSV